MARQARHDLGQSRLCKLALSIHGSGRKTALFLCLLGFLVVLGFSAVLGFLIVLGFVVVLVCYPYHAIPD